MPAPTPPRLRRISDPLAAALLPPTDETQEAREARLAQEREAKKVSDTIDEQLRQEKEARKAKLRTRKEIKVLLLGQSESGKSTTLKQFQLAYTPNAFREERLAWRPVVYLNLVRSVRRIIDALSPSDSPHGSSASDPTDDDDFLPQRKSRDSTSESYVRRPSIIQSVSTSPSATLFASAPYTELKSRLEPLLALEDQLMRQLATGDEDEATHLAWPAPTATKNAEISVNTRHNWKRALNKLAMGVKTGSELSHGDADGWWNDPSDPCHILDQSRPDIERLWGDAAVQIELQRRRIRLEESSGFYLDSLARITNPRYIPSDDDVLKARLKTVGVIEHTFSLETGKEKGVDWKIYDVGGARSQRHAWAPYFEDMNALIFLAPISAFDQVLTEDPRVNRVEDSLLLWRSVVANKLLAGVNIILFLNKCDLLQAKLEAGVRLNQYMTSYGDRPNDHESVSKYFRSKFLALNQSYSPNPNREVYLHLTAVTDTRRTSSIITNVRDIILRDDLRGVKLL